MLLVISKRPSLSLYLGTHLKEQLTDYCFILKVTSVFPTPTQAMQTEHVEQFAND